MTNDAQHPTTRPSLSLTFTGLAHSPALEDTIRGAIDHIDAQCPGVLAWHVTVAQESRHHKQGNPFSVHVRAALPGHELAATRSHDSDAHAAAREAFDCLRRELQDVIRIQRGQVKQHG